MSMESDQLLPHLGYHCDFLDKKLIKGAHVAFDVGAGLVDLVKKCHLLLDQVDHIVYVVSVPRN